MVRQKPLFVYRSDKSAAMNCYSLKPDGVGLPESLAPWVAIGVLRPDQATPPGVSSSNIMAGIEANGYQLWRRKSAPEGGAKQRRNDAGPRTRQ